MRQDPSAVGAQTAELGTLRNSRHGHREIVAAVVVGVCSVFAVPVLILLAVVGQDLRFAGAAVAALLLGPVLICFIVFMVWRKLKTSVTLHEHGMVAVQAGGRVEVIHWADVGSMRLWSTSLGRGGRRYYFQVDLRTGETLYIDRLELSPPLGGGRDPEVAFVLEQYEQWSRRNGFPHLIVG